MVQPLLWLCLSHMSMNNKNRALKNKPQCFKKPSGEYLQWYHIFSASFWSFFFTVEVDIFFLLLNQHFLTANHSQKFSIQPWSGCQHLVLVHAHEKRLMSISENYLHDVQKGTTSVEQHLHLGKSGHSLVSLPQSWGQLFSGHLHLSWWSSFACLLPNWPVTWKKNPSMGNTVFRDTAHPLSNALGTFRWF